MHEETIGVYNAEFVNRYTFSETSLATNVTHQDQLPIEEKKENTESVNLGKEKETKEPTSSIRNVATSNQPGIERNTLEYKEPTEVTIPAPESNTAAGPVKPDEILTAKQDSKQIEQGSDANNNWRQVQSDVAQMHQALEQRKTCSQYQKTGIKEKKTVLINTLQNTLGEEQQVRTRVEEELNQARIAYSELEVRSQNELAQMRQTLDNEIRLRNTREQELKLEKEEIVDELQKTLYEVQQARTREIVDFSQTRSAYIVLKGRLQNELQVKENASREQQRILEEERQQKTDLEDRLRTLQLQMEEERNRHEQREMLSRQSLQQELQAKENASQSNSVFWKKNANRRQTWRIAYGPCNFKWKKKGTGTSQREMLSRQSVQQELQVKENAITEQKASFGRRTPTEDRLGG
ncbi:hypothetical protein OS493_039463 [Desmophyllum pertusum]|uniref:Uncharacterized protein n=1 Tax=Desmophyllum pertusum TaxID=174260 RepID=A0A9W9ZHB8_9CNID|nr:hypothetical protein OS493_039463 [Desmophyllum pertusum]